MIDGLIGVMAVAAVHWGIKTADICRNFISSYSLKTAKQGYKQIIPEKQKKSCIFSDTFGFKLKVSLD